MKQQSIRYFPNLLFLKLAGVCCLLSFSPVGILGQCSNKITVPSGTESFSCTNVTVTSAGSVEYQTFCNIGPYWVGRHNSGSYTFSFSTPVSGVTLDINKVDNGINGVEEVEILINGALYTPTNTGVLSSCDPVQIVVSPSSTLICPCFGCAASCEFLQIDHIISTITIRDKYISDFPNGVSLTIQFCCGACFVDAGVVAPPLIQQLCPNSLATVPPATLTFLSPGTLLQYILFSDLNDTLGSIIAISNTPSFGFNPATMQEGTTYYIASVAGDDLNGNVDLNSFCLDFSNVIEVVWRPKPTVVFSVDNSNICVGDCTMVTTTFTGDPPFTLTYSTSLTGPLTKVFQDDLGTIEICAPLNLAPGSLNIQAINLTDGHCTCN